MEELVNVLKSHAVVVYVDSAYARLLDARFVFRLTVVGVGRRGRVVRFVCVFWLKKWVIVHLKEKIRYLQRPVLVVL